LGHKVLENQLFFLFWEELGHSLTRGLLLITLVDSVRSMCKDKYFQMDNRIMHHHFVMHMRCLESMKEVQT